MEMNTRELQLSLLEMMSSFHSACVEHGLRYYMLGGTCLGAIRHSGFIPWDDDVDVGMPREDYERFCKIASDILPENLILRYYRNTKDSPFHFVKLVNKNTTLVEKYYTDYVEGIYIDVFPLDGIRRFNTKTKLRTRRIRLKHAIIRNHYNTSEKKRGLKKIFMFLSKQMRMDRVHESLERLMTRENHFQTEYLCNFLGSWKDREIIPKKIFGKPALYQFENAEFYGPEDANAYLTSLYNDYMTPPPKEKQVCRHDYYYVNLELPFDHYHPKDGKRTSEQSSSSSDVISEE